MGALCTKKSQNLSNSQEKKPIVDSSSYILGKHRFKPAVKTSDEVNKKFDYNRLNFIPDSKRLWDFPLTSRLPQIEPIVQKSSSVSNLSLLPQQRLQYFNYSTNMFNQHKCRCDQCGIVFPSDDHLIKHKERFCIGVKDSGIGRRPVYSDDEDLDDNSSYYNNKNNNLTKKPSLKKVIRYQSPRRKKADELDDWKSQRSMREPVHDVEDQILNNTRRGQKTRDHSKSQDEIYNEILIQYDQLQSQQRDILLQLYNLQTESKPVKDFDAVLKKNNDIASHNPNIQLEELQRRNNRLEVERRIIQKKLEELILTNFQPAAMSNYDPYKILREMKEQQELNEKALDFLRERLIFSTGSLCTLSNLSPLPHVNNRIRQTVGNNVRNSRNNYLQSGGHDASIITRYSDLEYRLNAYENYPWTKDYPEPLKQSQYKPERRIDPLAEGFKLVNDENDRLQNELSEMHKKFEILDTRTRQLELSLSNSTNDFKRYPGSDVSGYPPTQSSVRGNNNNTNHNNNQLDPSGKNQLASSSIFDKRVSPRSSPALSLLSSNMSKLRDSLAPQTYDPVGGFTIFFDFILDLPPNIGQCCLVTSIHHPKPGLGEPSILDSATCNQYVDDHTAAKINYALIATKQPVPGCPPQQALTVVIEVQTAAAREMHNAELQANAWTKFALFDNKNRLLSGRWKVPLKALPIAFNESLAIISTLPTFGRAELYYRLVNSQDANEQANAPLSPKYRDFYHYPVQYRN